MLSTGPKRTDDPTQLDASLDPPELLLARARRLNSEAWTTMKMSSAEGGTVRLTPVNGEFAARFRDARFASYGTTGVSSESLKTAEDLTAGRPANFWLSEYTPPDRSFRLALLRSATLPRYGESDDDTRAALSARAADEVLYAARLLRPAGRLVSIDLQSPGETGSHFEIEDATICEQARALGAAASPIPPLFVNIPVHGRSYQGAGDWDIVGRQRPIVEEIAARAAAANRELTERCAAQLRALLDKEAVGRASPLERYALAARIGFLAYAAGDIPYLNCRSGKDRTGFLDAEIKFVAYQEWRAQRGFPISAPAGAVLESEQSAWRFFVIEAGNLEIQRLNTGYAGYKLNDPLLRERVGDSLWEEFLGQSGMARV